MKNLLKYLLIQTSNAVGWDRIGDQTDELKHSEYLLGMPAGAGRIPDGCVWLISEKIAMEFRSSLIVHSLDHLKYLKLTYSNHVFDLRKSPNPLFTMKAIKNINSAIKNIGEELRSNATNYADGSLWWE